MNNEKIDNSNIKRDFRKLYHQQAANKNDSNQNIVFLFGENTNYRQFGNAYLEYELTIEIYVAVAAKRVLEDGDAIRLVKNAFAYCFKEARLSTTGGTDIEHNKYVGQVSTIMRTLTSRDVDLLYHFDESDESETETQNTSLHHHLINNHDLPATKGKVKGQLPIEHFSGFC